MKLDPEEVYFTDAEGGYIAAFPRREDDRISWFGLEQRERAYTVAEVLEDGPEGFTFRDTHGRDLRVVPLTLEAYEAIRVRLGSPKYKSLKALRAAIITAVTS